MGVSNPTKVIVVGTGPCWQEEFEEVWKYNDDADVIAVNWSIPELPKVTHAVTQHPDKLEVWLEDRTEKITTHSRYNKFSLANYEWPFESKYNSGLCGILLAKWLAYDSVYVVGVPLSEGYKAKFLIRFFLDNKNLFTNVFVPDNYWWKEYVKD